jgi:hypothetical protein
MAAEPAALHGNTSTSGDFVFEHAGEPWHVLAFLVLAVALAWWGWKRYGETAPGAIGQLARLCRTAALVVLALIIAGPAWMRTTTSTLPGRLLVAVDRSASMARTDGPGGSARIAAASTLASALHAAAAGRHLVVEYRAIGGISGAIAESELIKGPLSATGAASPLADELAQLVAELRPDGLVVVSDGRVTAGSSLTTLPADWRGHDLQVSVLSTGTDSIEPELIIDEVVVNREVALDEREPVTVRLSSRALPAGPITVHMSQDDEPAVTVEAANPGGDQAAMAAVEAKLEAVFHHEGPAKLHIVVEAGSGPSRLHREQEVAVTVSERKLKVLMLEYRPRYEVRYLREAFRRDKTVVLHAYLAEGKWRRWGSGSAAEAGPDHLPLSPSELGEYDVIIIGDLGPDSFRDADLTAIDAAVRHRGAGLVWLPGETGAISGFIAGKLGALIPVELPEAAAISRGYLSNQAHQLSRTPFAAKLGLLDAGEVDWKELPFLLGASPVQAVKPAADVLVEDQRHLPLVVSRAYGSGRSLFIGVDDTWRWRRNVGDRYLHRFHSQLFRYVAAGRRLGNQDWALHANPRRASPGEVITLDMTPTSSEPVENPPDSITVRLKGPGGEQLVRLARDGNGYSAHVPAPAAGMWSMEIAAGAESRQVDCGQLLVLPPTDELRDPRLDAPALGALASGTGGMVYTDPDKLVAELPDLSRSESVSAVTGWWDSLWALALAVCLFAIDWSIRRMSRLP